MPYLVFDSGEGQRVQVAVTSDGARIGRDPSCDLVIPTEAASRHHATVRLEPAGVRFIDERSHNGSSVNGARVAEATLRDGDVISIAGFVITYLEVDPYGDDSISMPTPADAVRVAPVGPAPPRPQPEPAPDPRARPRTGLLLFVAVATLLLIAVVALVAWRLLPTLTASLPQLAPATVSPVPTPATTPPGEPEPTAEPTWTWSDPADTVHVPIPPEFREAERTDGGIRFLGPRGGRFDASITATIVAAITAGGTGSEASIVERGLVNEHQSGFNRLGSGEVVVGGAPARFLLFQRPTPERVLLQQWLVLTVIEGKRVSFNLTAEIGEWERVKPAFATFLSRIRFPAPATPISSGGARPRTAESTP